MSEHATKGIASRLFNTASGIFFGGTAIIATLETAAIAARSFPVPFIEHPPVAIGVGLLAAFAAAGSAVYSFNDFRRAFAPRPQAI